MDTIGYIVYGLFWTVGLALMVWAAWLEYQYRKICAPGYELDDDVDGDGCERKLGQIMRHLNLRIIGCHSQVLLNDDVYDAQHKSNANREGNP